MASDNCIYCGAQILSTAVTCPKCRQKVHRKTSILSWVVGIVVMLVIFVASQFMTTNHSVANKNVSSQSSKSP